MLKKTIHIIVAFLFVVFAAVQYNDSDSIKWILIYLAVAGLPILMLLNINKQLLNYFLIGFFPVLLIMNFSSVSEWINAGQPGFIDYEPTTLKAVEGIREYLGLVVCFITTFLYVFIKKGPKDIEA